ncbi:MAG: preprotein translocase subunit SecY [bacterium]
MQLEIKYKNMPNIVSKIKMIWLDASLRKRILFVIVALLVFRLLANIPVPGVDPQKLAAFFSNNEYLGLLNMFSGGGMTNLSIVMLGVGPYITSSIIMQLLTMMFPKLKQMYQEEGEIGRRKFTMYSRYLTVPLAIIQAASFAFLLSRQGILDVSNPMSLWVNVSIITAGSIFLMWLGELMTEFGIGNGTSLIIFAGIVSSIPEAVTLLIANYQVSDLPMYIAVLVASLAVIVGVVVVTEAERPIPVTYAKRIRGMRVFGGVSTYLPLRLTQAGVIPIIFALSILMFPQMIAKFLMASANLTVVKYATYSSDILANGWFYGIAYFLMVFLFTYFYTAVTFDPHNLAKNLQNNGAFIPGVRPGETTANYIAKVLTRITLVGATFLGLVAVLPMAVKGITGISSIAIGGTALLIVVSVVIDLIKKVEAQISMREY